MLIPYGRSWVVSVSVEHDGASPTISAATFTLYTPNGEARVDAQVATVSGGTLSYTVAADVLTLDDMGTRWLVKFEATIGGNALPFYCDAAVCLAPLYPPAGTTDLINRYSKLDDLQASGSSELQTYITDAWQTLTQKLYSDGVPFWQMRTPGALREWMIARALSYSLDDLALLLDGASHYSDEARRHEAMLDALYAQIRARMDTNEDNTAGDTNEGASPVLILTSNRSPIYRRR